MLFGLRPLGANKYDYTRKRTYIIGNLPGLEKLNHHCRGTSASHKHVRAWGTAVVGNKRISRAVVACRYPKSVCVAIAELVKQVLKFLI